MAVSVQDKWLNRYYSYLLGFKIVGFELRKDEDGEWPVFTVQMGDEKFEIEIARDEEGNGPGFIFGLPTPPS